MSGKTVPITVEKTGNSCLNQSDLIRGNEKFVMDIPYYWDAMDTDVYEVACGGVTPTPTPEATVTPTPGATATPTPGPTATPGPGPTATPGPAATPTSAVAGALASTGNLGFIYLLVAAGVISLISGMALRKFSK
jgi:hypothetical protein